MHMQSIDGHVTETQVSRTQRAARRSWARARARGTAALLGAALVGTALLASAPSAAADGTTCPDLRAVNRGPEFSFSSIGTRCRRAFAIFGLEITVGTGNFCPATETVTPAHRECEPVPNSGTDCKATEAIEVRVRDCQCIVQYVPDFGAFSADCVCRYSGGAGFVWDHESVECDAGT